MQQHGMMGYGQQVMGHHQSQMNSMMNRGGMMQGGSGFMMPNNGVGMQYNPWARPNFNYTSMPGFCQVDYTGGWNPNVHDMMLKQKINHVFMQYDMNRNGQLEGQEFYGAYRDLCLMMGMAPPQTLQEVWHVAMQNDLNGDGMISPMEMFILFKKLQGINAGMMMQPGMMSMAW